MRRTVATLPFLLLAFVIAAPAQTYTQSAIDSLPSATESPSAIIQGSDGNFYGTAEGGGSQNGGILFKVTPTGKFTTVFSFCSQTDCGNTGGPVGPVIEGGDGNFYGTTPGGGANGDGIIYKITPSGAFSTLYTFCSQTECHDGFQPFAGLIQGSDGNFYGTTVSGGPNPTYGGGTLFKITPSGTYTVVHNFCTEGGASCTDGSSPLTLVQGSDGNFYGATNGGGAYAYGAIFKLTPSGTYTKLYDFCGPSDPCITDESPAPSALVEGSDGDFYGVTSQDGAYGFGSLFRITSGGTFTKLYDFCSQGAPTCPDGALPFGLTAASNGNLYGATWSGGETRSGGTVFQLTPAGALTQILNLCASPNVYGECPEGNTPSASPIQGSDGNFYGATEYGGKNSVGVIYSITAAPALAPPVQLTLSASTINRGDSFTLNWKVLNAFSTTMRQCYGFINGPASTGGAWTGLQAGTYNSTTKVYAPTTPVTITPTGAGTYTYALTCGGQESGLATLTVIGDASTTAFSASPSPAFIGQTVALTATASSAGTSGPTPTGSVTFVSFGQVVGTVKLNDSGVAAFSASTAGLVAGAYPVTAEYSGDANYNASSTTATVTLKKIPTATTLTASSNTVTRPGDITLTATVRRTAESGTPAGSVTFAVENTVLGYGVLSSGVATFTASSKGQPVGTYPVHVTYNGDTSDAASISPSVTVKVQ